MGSWVKFLKLGSDSGDVTETAKDFKHISITWMTMKFM